MLTAATLGMTGYGLYAVGAALVDVFGPAQLSWIANLIAVALGALLVAAAVCIRVGLPGSLALALTALFGLQSLSLHSAARLYGQVAPEPQIARALFAAVLVGLAYFGAVGNDETGDPAPEGGEG
ncbi:MAG: hypothetical protein VX427_03050 [Acidobacteriota bacterium]|nr:hypothetical protein [Acidobacteriota bacterium]